MSGQISAQHAVNVNRRDINLLMAASFLYSFNFTMLLPITPLFIEERGGGNAAGLVNTALLVATVVTQWLSPLLLRRWTKKQLFVVALLLMGLPAVAYIPATDGVAIIFAASIIRGAGFGILTVISAALVIDLSPGHARGSVLGRFGLATAVPAIFGPSLGLHLLETRSAYEPALLGVAASLLGVILVCCVTQLRRDGSMRDRDNAVPGTVVFRMLKDRQLAGLALAFMLVSVAWGGTTSFLPLSLPAQGLASAASFLFISGLLRAVGRWLAGVWFDHGVLPVRASVPTVGIMAIGLSLLTLDTSPAIVIASAAIYGTGLGFLQTFLFLAMVHRNTYGQSAASALWATSLDLGGVIGTSVLAGVAAIGGYQAVLYAMPLIMLIAVPILVVGQRLERTGQHIPNDQMPSDVPKLWPES